MNILIAVFLIPIVFLSFVAIFRSAEEDDNPYWKGYKNKKYEKFSKAVLNTARFMIAVPLVILSVLFIGFITYVVLFAAFHAIF